MNTFVSPTINPETDLVLERVVEVTPEQVFRAWTEPELLKQWFTPKPWTTALAELDLRPGGIFRTVMRGPEGEEFDGTGCVLEVIQNRRFVWTSVMAPGYRPQPTPDDGGFLFTAIIEMQPEGSGCRYTATVMHANPDEKAQHEGMGFHTGWGAALDQLVEVMMGR